MKASLLTAFVVLALRATSGYANVIPAGTLPGGVNPPAPIGSRHFDGIARDVWTRQEDTQPPVPDTVPTPDTPDPDTTTVSSAPTTTRTTLSGYLSQLVNGLPFGFGSNKVVHRRGDEIDVQYLNYALLLEQFETAFYERGLERFKAEAFRKAGYPDWVRNRFRQIAHHEKVHKEFLESAVIAAGSEPVRPLKYDFRDNDVHAFVETSAAVSSIAVSAYIGSLQCFNNRAYITAEASILAVEAREAAWINSAVRNQNPWNTAFETPLTPSQVLTLLSVFLRWESLPEEHHSRLPPGIRPHPHLMLSPRLVPGEQAEISFTSSEHAAGAGERLYVAFLAGSETIFGPVFERKERHEHKEGHAAAAGARTGPGATENPGAVSGKKKAESKREASLTNSDLSSSNTDTNNNVLSTASKREEWKQENEGRRRFFVEIPRDLAARGTVYAIVVKGRENIGEVRLDDESTVAGPAIAMFPFEADGRPVVW